MGIRDYISATTVAISSGITRSREFIGEAAGKARVVIRQNTPGLARVASESAVRTRQVVVERMPDREGLERIGRLGLRIVDHAMEHGTKPYTGGIPVYKIVKTELSKNKSQEQPQNQEKENVELATLKAKNDYLEKENMELQQLKLRMESLEKKFVENEQNDLNQKAEKKPNSVLQRELMERKEGEERTTIHLTSKL